MWTAIGRHLEIDGRIVASFSHSIRRARQVEETVLVVIDVPPKIIYSDNLFGYVLPEQRLWQIQLTSRLGIAAADICVVDIPERPFQAGTAHLDTWAGVT